MSSFDPGPRPGSTLGSSSGFNVGKFLGLTAALAVGAGVGVGGYYGTRALASDSDAGAQSTPAVDEAPPTPSPKTDVGTGGADAPDGPRRDVPAVDEPSDPNALRLDVPDPWGLSAGEPAPGGGGGGGGGGGVTQETY